MRKVILASTSPRRKQLMNNMGLQFSVVPSDFVETLDDTRAPEDVAKELGLGKALAVAQKYTEALVIGSDTIVTVGHKQLGKARDVQEAREMLRLATAAPNKITTSIVVVCRAERFEFVDVATAYVFLRPFDAEVIEAYLATGDYADKAGAYGVQSGFAPMVDHIQGDYDTVLGLPTSKVATILNSFGISAHPAKLKLPAGLIVK
jgi:septum formation protein